MRFTNAASSPTVIVLAGNQSVYAAPAGSVPASPINISTQNTPGYSSIVVGSFGSFTGGQYLDVDVSFQDSAGNLVAELRGRTQGDSVTGTVVLRFPMLTPYWRMAITYTGVPLTLDVAVSTVPANVPVAANGASEIGSGVSSTFAPSAVAATILPANPGRLDAGFFNGTNQTCYLLLANTGTVSASLYTVALVAGAYYELPKSQVGVYRGNIAAVFAAGGTGLLQVTEYY